MISASLISCVHERCEKKRLVVIINQFLTFSIALIALLEQYVGFFSTVLIIFKVSVLNAHKGGASKDD